VTTDFQPRYIVVEGPIGVGKTTLARRLAESYGTDLVLEMAEENPFLTRYYQQPEAAALPTQLYFLMQRARQMQALFQADLFKPVQVSDFLMEKDRLFAELTLNEDELALYEQVYAALNIDAPMPDLVIYLQASPEVLLQRIQKRGLASEKPIREEYLQRLVDSYINFFYYYNAAPLLIVNAEQVNFVSGDSDYQQLLQRLKKITKGRHYFNPAAIN
jgi:deoxyadenosine/deoxycytidine kinase